MGGTQSTLENDTLTMVKTEKGLESSVMNDTKIKGLTRLITEESRRRGDKDRDEHDIHKDNMMLLKQMYKKMDPTIMKTSTYTTHGEVEIAYKYLPTREIMLIKVLRARDLNAKDLRGKSSDPYVQMYLHGTEGDGSVMQTQAANKTLNPVYHEIFSLPITDKQLNESTLVVQVWDHDVIGKDDLIGEALVPFSKFDFVAQNTHTAWHELRAETDLHITGDLEVSLRYKLPQTLIIHVHGGSNLTNRYENGSPNPFVKIAIPGIPSVFKTKTKFNTIGPKWEESFEIEVPQEEFGYRYIVLHCIDYERGGPNESLGQVIIDLKNLDPEEGMSGTFPLQDLKNSERLRSRWFQHTTMQEFRESLIAHAAVRFPRVMFQEHYGSKVLKLKSVKAGSNARLRLVNGIPVY